MISNNYVIYEGTEYEQVKQKYLVVAIDENGASYMAFATARELANRIGFNDCEPFDYEHIYKLDGVNLKELKVNHDGCKVEFLEYLPDVKMWQVIDYGYYDEH